MSTQAHAGSARHVSWLASPPPSAAVEISSRHVAAVAIAAPVGDLFESLLKRDLGTKDTGTLFGPHGGILDRLDAVFFTIVVGYYLAVALVY